MKLFFAVFSWFVNPSHTSDFGQSQRGGSILTKDQLNEIENEARCKSLIDPKSIQERINEFLRLNEDPEIVPQSREIESIEPNEYSDPDLFLDAPRR